MKGYFPGIVGGCFTAPCSLIFSTATLAISPSEFDAFETGTTLAWAALPAPDAARVAVNCASGSDCLENESTGAGSLAPWQIVVNEAQWTGDYFEAGINGVEVWLRNTGATKLDLRIGITNDPDGPNTGVVGTCFVSQTAVTLDPGATQQLRFGIRESEMALVGNGVHCGGSSSLQEVMSNVTQLRIYSAFGASWVPDVVASKLLIDNIRPIARAATQWQWIALKGDPNDDCPIAGNPTNAWMEGHWFGDPRDPNASAAENAALPDALRRFCSYRLSPGVVASRLQTQRVTQLVGNGVAAANPDLLAVTPADTVAGRAGLPQLGSPPGIAGIEDTLYESLAERFGIYAGRPEFMHGDPPYPQTGTPVRLVVIDTQPNSFDELDPAGQTASLHGITLMRAASWLLCDSGARPAAVPDFSSCVAEVVGRVALSYRCTTDSDVINPGGDPDSCRLKQEGGYTGSMVELARAVWDEVNDWLDEGATSRLVLNGSLNWDVLYGGDETVVGEMPVPVQAVHAAVQDARCRGALPLFTSGNRVNGPGNLRGPSLPGLWEGRDGSTEAECIAALAPHDLPNPVDFPVDASSYFPLLYAVGGVQADNRPLPGAGSDAEPRLVAMADHAAIPTLENVGIGNALGRHGTLTGPSVATLVVSATTAVAWHYRSDLPAYRLMNAVHGAGLDLGRPADLFPPSARPPPGPAHPAVRDDRLGLPDHRDRGLPPAGEPAGLPAREDVRVPVPRGG